MTLSPHGQRLAEPPREARPSLPTIYLVLFISVAAMSWAAPLVRFTEAPALAVSFWRLAFSLPLIGAALTIRGEWATLAALGIRDLAVAALAGVFLAAHFATWIASVTLTSVAASVALVSTQPVWVAIFAAATLREFPAPRQWAGIVLAVLGAAVIGWGDRGGGTDPLLGDLLALSGAALVAAYYVIGRDLRRKVPLWPYVGIVYGFAALTLLLSMLVSGTPLIGDYAAGDWLVFLLLAIGPMMIGHTAQNWALRYLPAFAVNLTLMGEPVGATLIAWTLPAIAETPPLPTLAGGVLILSGITLGLRRNRDG